MKSKVPGKLSVFLIRSAILKYGTVMATFDSLLGIRYVT
jgi:hypothetical protein